MLVPLGVSHKFKTLDNIFNGITLSIFGLFLLTFGLSLATISTKYELIIKLCAFVSTLSRVKSHKVLKNNIKDFLGMTEAIEDFESKRCPNNFSFNYSLILFLLTFLSVYISCVFLVASSPFQDQIFNGFKIVHIKVMLSHHFTFTSFIPIYSTFLLQFLYFEFCIHYYNVLNFSNNFIKRYLSFRPDVRIRYIIDKVIEDFQENDSQYEKFLDPIRKSIWMIYLSFNICFSFELILLLIKHDFTALAVISMLFFFNFYFIFTQIFIYNKSKSQKVLLKTIEKWKTLAEKGHKFRGSLLSKPFTVENSENIL